MIIQKSKTLDKHHLRRGLRFSLASMLFLITAFGIWLGFVNNSAIRQRAAVRKLRAVQCSVGYDDGVDADDRHTSATSSTSLIKTCLANLLGKDAVYRVVRVGLFVDATDSDLEVLSDLPDIEELEVAAAMIQDEGLRHIGQLHELKSLSFDSIGVISHSGFAALRQLTQLKSLRVQNSRGDEVIQALDGLSNLRSLDVQHVSDVGVTDLATSFPSLHELHIRGSMSDEGLESLRKLTDLEVLYLSGHDFTNEGLDALSPLAKLRVLSIDNSSISDTGLEHLSNLSSLTHLNLIRTRITGAGLHHVKHLPLISLDMRGGRLTPAGLDAIAEMQNLAVLKISGDYLHLLASVGPAGRAIRTADLEQLRQKRPQLVIEK